MPGLWAEGPGGAGYLGSVPKSPVRGLPGGPEGGAGWF